MMEATQVAGLRQDGQSQNRTDSRNLPQPLKVAAVAQVVFCPLFHLMAQLAKVFQFRKHDAEHGDGFRIIADR